jgi:hypothetical protein
MPPFMSLYGYCHSSITLSLIGKEKVQAVEDHIENQQEVLQLLKENLAIAKNRTKQQANKHCGKKEKIKWGIGYF